MSYSQTAFNTDGIPNDVTRKARIEGHLPSIIGGGDWHDVWEGGTQITPEPSDSGAQLLIRSTSGNDTVAGTGVQRVLLLYINTAGETVSEQLDMAGTTGVLTTATDIVSIYDFHSTLVGTNKVAVGTITLKNSLDTILYNQITEGGNKSLCTLRHLRPNDTFYITSIVTSGDTKGTDIMLRSDSTDGGEVYPNVWLFAVPITLTEGAVTPTFSPALEIPGGARVKISARSQVGGGTVSVFVNGWLREG